MDEGRNFCIDLRGDLLSEFNQTEESPAVWIFISSIKNISLSEQCAQLSKGSDSKVCRDYNYNNSKDQKHDRVFVVLAMIDFF